MFSHYCLGLAFGKLGSYHHYTEYYIACHLGAIQQIFVEQIIGGLINFKKKKMYKVQNVSLPPCSHFPQR